MLPPSIKSPVQHFLHTQILAYTRILVYTSMYSSPIKKILVFCQLYIRLLDLFCHRLWYSTCRRHTRLLLKQQRDRLYDLDMNTHKGSFLFGAKNHHDERSSSAWMVERLSLCSFSYSGWKSYGTSFSSRWPRWSRKRTTAIEARQQKHRMRIACIIHTVLLHWEWFDSLQYEPEEKRSGSDIHMARMDAQNVHRRHRCSPNQSMFFRRLLWWFCFQNATTLRVGRVTASPDIERVGAKRHTQRKSCWYVRDGFRFLLKGFFYLLVGRHHSCNVSVIRAKEA